MPEAELERIFPRLRDEGYKPTSPIEIGQNCVSYAAGDAQRRWWDPFKPDGYWPDGLDRDDSIQTFVRLFESMGFKVCQDESVEPGFEKVAIYGTSGTFGHVALQLPSGAWASKLGELEDIEHQTLAGLISVHYGHPVRYLRRQMATEEV